MLNKIIKYLRDRKPFSEEWYADYIPFSGFNLWKAKVYNKDNWDMEAFLEDGREVSWFSVYSTKQKALENRYISVKEGLLEDIKKFNVDRDEILKLTRNGMHKSIKEALDEREKLLIKELVFLIEDYGIQFRILEDEEKMLKEEKILKEKSEKSYYRNNTREIK